MYNNTQRDGKKSMLLCIYRRNGSIEIYKKCVSACVHIGCVYIVWRSIKSTRIRISMSISGANASDASNPQLKPGESEKSPHSTRISCIIVVKFSCASRWKENMNMNKKRRKSLIKQKKRELLYMVPLVRFVEEALLLCIKNKRHKPTESIQFRVVLFPSPLRMRL